MKNQPTLCRHRLAMLKRRGFTLEDRDGETMAVQEIALPLDQAIAYCAKLRNREKTARWKQRRAEQASEPNEPETETGSHATNSNQKESQ